ncbi:hypothetical protein SAMN05192533_11225 [Mesobacillus persicus]|uniref:Uncharacterized protein n=1 Tax=Mesobacillus persicus TaxID=930146 RepID=A0A1H8FZ64_9BACI|nr:hypothetical protein [Mesobacillus persicus]SEN37141.1 hypothetical protein SAMN05192533_11225 [Mesobacillus persicus]
MLQPLSKSEVHQLMSLLDPEQREFIEKYSKQSKKSKWIEAIARRKGIVITEETAYEEIEPLIDDWVLVDVLDSGFGNRDYRCECGRALRYQYRVLHKREEKVYGYGVSCFEHHTNLAPNLIKDILKGFHSVDLERDEILIKYFQGDFWNLKPFLHIETIPYEILEQDRLDLPLTDNQRIKVLRLKKVYEQEQLLERVLSKMDSYQKEVFQALGSTDQHEIIQKLSNDKENTFTELPSGFIDKEVILFYSAGLPLLERHYERIREYRWEQYKVKRRSIIDDGNQSSWASSGGSTLKTGRMVVPSRPIAPPAKIDYQTIIDRHLETLKSVRSNEDKLSEGLMRDWKTIEEQIRGLKAGKEMDYSSFKLNLTNICYALHIALDEFL